jgi:hypothetical protein
MGREDRAHPTQEYLFASTSVINIKRKSQENIRCSQILLKKSEGARCSGYILTNTNDRTILRMSLFGLDSWWTEREKTYKSEEDERQRGKQCSRLIARRSTSSGHGRGCGEKRFDSAGLFIN